MALDTPLPVYFLYWTALAGADGTAGFRPDPYGRDAPLIAALAKDNDRPVAQAVRLNTEPQRIVPYELTP